MINEIAALLEKCGFQVAQKTCSVSGMFCKEDLMLYCAYWEMAIQEQPTFYMYVSHQPINMRKTLIDTIYIERIEEIEMILKKSLLLKRHFPEISAALKTSTVPCSL